MSGPVASYRSESGSEDSTSRLAYYEEKIRLMEEKQLELQRNVEKTVAKLVEIFSERQKETGQFQMGQIEIDKQIRMKNEAQLENEKTRIKLEKRIQELKDKLENEMKLEKHNQELKDKLENEKTRIKLEKRIQELKDKLENEMKLEKHNQELKDKLENEKTRIKLAKRIQELKDKLENEMKLEKYNQELKDKLENEKTRIKLAKHNQELKENLFFTEISITLLIVFNPLGVLIGCLSAFALGIKKHPFVYVATVVFASLIPLKGLVNAGTTIAVFVGSLLGIYSCMRAANKRSNGIAYTINWLVIVTVLSEGLSLPGNLYSTSVYLLPSIIIAAILTHIIHVSFKARWYCIFAACCGIHLLSFLILPMLYPSLMLQLTQVRWLRAALATYTQVRELRGALAIYTYVRELRATWAICLIAGYILPEAQEVITVKNCIVFKYVGSGLSFLWRDYGIELHIPATSDLIDDIVVTVEVRALDESFQIPNRSEFVSAIYSISTSRPLPVEAVLRIQHCVPGHMVTSERLTFVYASNGAPYEFQQLKGGKFSKYSCYGEIKVSKFSEYAIMRLLQGLRQPHAPTDLVVGVYSYGTRASFIVTRNLTAHLRAVEEEMNGKTDKSTTVLIDENLEKIALDVPTQGKGWGVTSTFTPAVLPMKVIRDFQPGKAIPKISLEMDWLKSSEPAKPADVVVKVSGLEMLEEFKLPCGRTSVSPLPPTRSCLTALLQYLKPKIEPSQFIGRLNIDRDFIHVRQLLHNLNKEELKAIGRHLGLSNNTVNNFYDNSVNSYCEEIITAWMNERDSVLSNGGATWENLKKALESEGLTGHAAKIRNIHPPH